MNEEVEIGNCATTESFVVSAAETPPGLLRRLDAIATATQSDLDAADTKLRALSKKLSDARELRVLLGADLRLARILELYGGFDR